MAGRDYAPRITEEIEVELPKRAKDWTNVRVGNVVALRPVQYTEHHTIVWECMCDCGKRHTKTSSVLKRGVSYCANNCPLKPTNATHGQSYTREYRAWVAMKSRCNNPASKNYADYGGRGICVAPEWESDFSAFLGYIGSAPSTKHTVDRIDPDADYRPGNVRWATQKEQCRNRRDTIKVTIDGKDVALADYAEANGVPYYMAYGRYVQGARGPDVLTSAYTSYEGVSQGMLTVLREDGRDKHGNKLWLCKCTCGKQVHKSSKSLREGVKSCSPACGVAVSNRKRAADI